MAVPVLPLALPIGDEPNVAARPIVTWALLCVHLLVFVGVLLPTIFGSERHDRALAEEWRAAIGHVRSAEEIDELEAMTPEEQKWAYMIESLTTPIPQPDPEDLLIFEGAYGWGSPALYKLFTSLFLHAGVLATLYHILLLWILGDNIEHHLGRVPFLVLYLGGGALGALLGSPISMMGSTLPVLASTSAMGALLGAYFIFFRFNEVRVAYMGRLPTGRLSAGIQHVAARVALPTMFVFASILGHASPGARGATWIGVGLGLAAAYLIRHRFGPGEGEDPDQWYPEPLNVTAEPAVRVRELLDAGRDGDAAQVYLEHRRRLRLELDSQSLERLAEYFDAHGMVALARGLRGDPG